MRQAAAHQKVGKFNLAEGALRQVLAQAEQQDDKALAARVKNNLASIWILGSKKYRSSNEEPDVYLLESLAVAEENGDKDLETRVRINLGNLLIGWTNYEDAAFNFLKAAESAAKLDNNEMEAHARVGLAMAAAYHGAGDMAEENIAKATALAKQFKGPAEQTMLHSKAAHIYGILMGLAADDAGHRKYLAKSGAAYQQAIRIAREAGDEKSQAYNLGYLADLYQIIGLAFFIPSFPCNTYRLLIGGSTFSQVFAMSRVVRRQSHQNSINMRRLGMEHGLLSRPLKLLRKSCSLCYVLLGHVARSMIGSRHGQPHTSVRLHFIVI
jgi:tetratricopeptide (TPR) repeat protein